MLVVLISIASVGPAIWMHNADLVREQTIQLMFAAVAAALCILERSYDRTGGSAKPRTAADVAAANGATWFSPLR